MSLPPLSPSSRFVMPISTRNSQYKFKTSCNIKILNPLVPLFSKEKPQNKVFTNNKADQVRSSFPPTDLYNSKFAISRLAPVSKPNQKKTTNSYLKKKYLDYLQTERHSEFRVNFNYNVPIRDYYKETVLNPNFNSENLDSKQKKTELKKKLNVSVPFIVSDEQKKKKSNLRYSTLIMPPPYNIQKGEVTKTDTKSGLSEKIMKKTQDFGKFINQSLQTDANSFDFDEWEFDYNA